MILRIAPRSLILSLGMLVLTLAVSTACLAKDPATVWNLPELKKVPQAQWLPEMKREVKNDAGKVVPVITRKVYYSSELYRGKPTRVMAFFSKPEGNGPFPAMVLVHGGGGTAFSAWTELWAARGYVAIAMDLAGYEITTDSNTEARTHSKQRLADGGPDQTEPAKFDDFSVENQEYREHWTWHSIAAIMRAHSLLLSLPYVDKNRTGATGISWGGYLTSMVSGIDDRFKVVVPVYGCGHLELYSFWSKKLANMPKDRAQRWIDFFDPASYMGAAKCKVFFLDGTDDLTYPLEAHRASWQLIPNADMRLEVWMGHSHVGGWRPKEIARYVNWVFEQGPPLPCLEPIQVKCTGKTITASAKIKYGAKATSAFLFYTTDPGGFNEQHNKWTKRNWKKIPATVSADCSTVSAILPADLPAGDVRFFLEAVDQDGFSATTHFEKKTITP